MNDEAYEDGGSDNDWDELEPTAADLAAIEDEHEVIEAEVTLTDAEIRLITVGRRRATELDWQRYHVAERAVLAAWLRLAVARRFGTRAVA
ncbi:DUF6284 family protein [Actinocatenispora sera]|uniref:Uncharacterized protein n=1 Tax=Actinocatenispora sera TaxID=390989 RepID=A0A810KXW6_9ACTN|nr:DUF6284 family protein [Actinocatenispora sera]BCJ27934.1 hypothetical protein Asera_20420 [Actinocatenispora sera]